VRITEKISSCIRRRNQEIRIQITTQGNSQQSKQLLKDVWDVWRGDCKSVILAVAVIEA